MKPVHVVQIMNDMNVGGIQNLLAGLVSSRSYSPFRQSVICSDSADGKLLRVFEETGCNVFACEFDWKNLPLIRSYRFNKWFRRQRRFLYSWRLSRLLKTLNCDIVHTHVSPLIHTQADVIINKVKLPMVWTIHATHNLDDKELRNWQRTSKMIEQSIGSVTVDSAFLAADFKSKTSIAEEKIKVVHPGIDIRRFQQNIGRTNYLRLQKNIPEDGIIFGCHSRLVNDKGIEVLIEAASILCKKNKNVRFFVSGEGPLREMLESQILRKNLSDIFYLVGFQEDLLLFLRELDVFVMPSLAEGYPLAVLEALSSGLPCIATDVSGVSEILNATLGIIVKPGDSSLLANAMETFCIREERERTRKTVTTKNTFSFSIEKCAEEFSNIYSQLLQ